MPISRDAPVASWMRRSADVAWCTNSASSWGFFSRSCSVRSGDVRPMDSWMAGPLGASNTGAGPRRSGTVSATISSAPIQATDVPRTVLSFTPLTGRTWPVAASPTHSSVALAVRRFSRKRRLSGDQRSAEKLPPAGSLTMRSGAPGLASSRSVMDSM